MESSLKKVCKCCGKELPLSEFGVSKFGTMRTCKQCVKQHQVEGHFRRKEKIVADIELANARKMRLSEFEPRELMQELKRRGYEFRLEYTETHVILSKDIEI